jgi:hypothetical protein
MSAGEGFLPYGNSVSINASTSSVAVSMTSSTAIVVTNRSTSSPAFVTWSGASSPSAAFPLPGDPTGSFGMEVCPGAQVTIGVNGQNSYVAVVLLSGTGIVTVVSGEGL